MYQLVVPCFSCALNNDVKDRKRISDRIIRFKFVCTTWFNYALDVTNIYAPFYFKTISKQRQTFVFFFRQLFLYMMRST